VTRGDYRLAIADLRLLFKGALMERYALIAELEKIVGKPGVLSGPGELAVYGYDGSIERHAPDAVVMPTSTEQVAEVVRLAARQGVPVVPRGAGTGLSGGSVPVGGGIVIGTARMRRILQVNVEDRFAVVEPGVINTDVTAAVAPHDLCYVPDPSSQTVSTIGGNVAENAGGPHCLAYGMTANHVLGLEVVLPDGQIVKMGSVAPDPPGYDLRGVMVGSEGTLGIVTKITMRRLPFSSKLTATPTGSTS
jgi:glycolate oxidase